MANKNNKGQGRGWHGDSEGHARAAQQQGQENSPGNFANDRDKASRTDQQSGGNNS